jgi:hypothetical protein
MHPKGKLLSVINCWLSLRGWQKSWKSGAVAERNPTVDLIIYLTWCLKIRNMYPQTHPNNNFDRNHADDPWDFWVPRKTHLVCNQPTRLELYPCPPPLFLDQAKHSRKLYIINRMKTIWNALPCFTWAALVWVGHPWIHSLIVTFPSQIAIWGVCSIFWHTHIAILPIGDS